MSREQLYLTSPDEDGVCTECGGKLTMAEQDCGQDTCDACLLEAEP